MPKYAEWIEYTRGGRSGVILKCANKQSRLILDERDDHLLVEDQEGPIWIQKNEVKIVEREE